MAQNTSIEWCDASSNPLRYRDRATGRDVWACVKHSSGCAHCYAEALALRYGRGGPFTRAEMAKVEPYLCEKETAKLLRSKTLAGKRVFLCDMTDLFGDWVPDDLLNRLFSNVLEHRTDVTFQILTKRADRMRKYLSWRWGEGRIPSRNIWLGVSVENQAAADERIPHLLETPAAVRFLSCEPLLGALDLSPWLEWGKAGPPWLQARSRHPEDQGPRNSDAWVIIGGESGPDFRPMQLEQAASLVAQCAAAGVPVFVKQDSGPRPGRQGRIPLDVWRHKEFPEPAGAGA